MVMNLIALNNTLKIYD